MMEPPERMGKGKSKEVVRHWLALVLIRQMCWGMRNHSSRNHISTAHACKNTYTHTHTHTRTHAPLMAGTCCSQFPCPRHSGTRCSRAWAAWAPRSRGCSSPRWSPPLRVKPVQRAVPRTGRLAPGAHELFFLKGAMPR